MVKSEQNDTQPGLSAEVGSTASCSYSATCSVSGYEGVCVSISSGCCSGTVTSGLCPGSDDIKCCTKVWSIITLIIKFISLIFINEIQ